MKCIYWFLPTFHLIILRYNLKNITNQAYFILFSWLSSCCIIFSIADIRILLQAFELVVLEWIFKLLTLWSYLTLTGIHRQWNLFYMIFLCYFVCFYCLLFIIYDLFVCWYNFRLICKPRLGLIELVKRGTFLFFALKQLVHFALSYWLSLLAFLLI